MVDTVELFGMSDAEKLSRGLVFPDALARSKQPRTPEEFGCTGSGDETTKLQNMFSSGENILITKPYFGDVLTVSTPQQIEMIGAGSLTVQSRISVTAPAMFKRPLLVNCPNKGFVIESSASGFAIFGARFKNMCRAYYDARKQNQSPSSFNYSALHLLAGLAGQIIAPQFDTIWGPQAVRVEGSGSTVQIIRAVAKDTFGRWLAMATGAAGNALLIDRPDLLQIGFLDDIGDGVSPTAIYCRGADLNPDCRIINPKIRYVVENGIEGPWGFIENPDIAYCGYRDPASHPNWTSTISLDGISSYGTIFIDGGKITNCRRGINVLAKSPSSIADVRIVGTDLVNNSENDVRVSANGTTAANVTVDSVKCRSAGGFFALVPSGTDVRFTDIDGAITRSGTPQAFFSWPSKGRFENLDRDHPRDVNSKVAGVLIHKDLSDGSAVPVLQIDAPAEGGGYAVFFRGFISNNARPGASSASTIPFTAMFSRTTQGDGTGVAGNVSVVLGNSAPTNASARDIASLTMSVTEITEQRVQVSATATKSGSDGPVLSIDAIVEVVGYHTSRVQLVSL